MLFFFYFVTSLCLGQTPENIRAQFCGRCPEFMSQMAYDSFVGMKTSDLSKKENCLRWLYRLKCTSVEAFAKWGMTIQPSFIQYGDELWRHSYWCLSGLSDTGGQVWTRCTAFYVTHLLSCHIHSWCGYIFFMKLSFHIETLNMLMQFYFTKLFLVSLCSTTFHYIFHTAC